MCKLQSVVVCLPLRGLAHSPGLPQMTALVGGDDVQAGGQAEAHASNERIRESHASQVQVGAGAQEGEHLLL